MENFIFKFSRTEIKFNGLEKKIILILKKNKDKICNLYKTWEV